MSDIQLREHQSLKTLNTFGIEVEADWLGILSERSQLEQLHHLWTQYPSPLILGGGSNVLFCQNYQGLVLLNRLKGLDLATDPDNDQAMLLTAAAGETWHSLVMYAVERNLGGIENLSLIPGTAGAAPIQNIGAYGVELKDSFHHLEALDLETGKISLFDRDNCMFGYRNSIFKHEFKGKYIITSITLRLQISPKLNISYGAIGDTLEKMGVTEPTVKAVSDAVIQIRQSKLPDPAVLGNAGSFFKNPEIPHKLFEQLKQEYPDIPGYATQTDTVKVPAGWLIEQCGWKGRRYGNTGAHKDQALVLVNYGNASGQEIYEHALRIIDNVKTRFEITLSPEVNII